MSPHLALPLGLALTAAGWLLTRAVAGARSFRRPGAVLLDALAPFAFFAVLSALSARPVFAGVAVFALFGGFAFADAGKRAVLSEPVVFTDMAALAELFRHPELYLAFVGYGRVIGGALAAVIAFGGLLLLEPAAWPWTPWAGLVGVAVLAALILGCAGPLLQPTASLLRRLRTDDDPHIDARAMGGLALQLAYGVVARAERNARRAAAPPPIAAPQTMRARPSGPPVFVVQSESFFDPRRMGAGVPFDLIPAFDACCAQGLQWGRLGVLGSGGNTMRTEFEVLTGLPQEALGFDRLNPYHAFSRAPLDSLAWRFRAKGYRTVCVHPFDRRFYRRDLAMPNLGFDLFLGEEAFPADAARDGPYIADSEVVRIAQDLLRDEGDGLFLFVITIANHGPWNRGPAGPASEDGELAAYLEGVRRSDAMLGGLAETLSARHSDGLMALYGDHLPSLQKAFARHGFTETSSDYVIWRPDARGPAERQDLGTPRDLHRAILASLR